MTETYSDLPVDGETQGDESRFVWPGRPWFLAGLLAICAILFWASSGQYIESRQLEPEQYRYALGAFFVVAGLATAFSLERKRWVWAVGFGVLWGIVLAGVAYWIGGYSPFGFVWNWAFGAGLIAVIIATPLFQTLRDNPASSRWKLSYDRLHFYSWSDTVIGACSLLFTGLSWLLLLLVSELFQLIGIDFIDTLIDNAYFGWAFSGGAFGAALGILRENDRILGLLQNVVLIVLSIMAPFLAVALVIFLFSLIFTGLESLWESTRGTTPILISCAVGAVILSNSIIRNNDAEESRSRILRVAAIILAITILPLAIVAAVSTGLRINQYGLTPERLWGLLIVVIATAYGLAYFVSVARAVVAKMPFDWTAIVRPANTNLAIGLCIVALFLSLPILDFGAWSARDQINRLNQGDVTEEEFDYYALANDFGPTGRALAEEMTKGGGARSVLAAKGLAAESRWSYRRDAERLRDIEISLVQPDRPLPNILREKVRLSAKCRTGACTVIWDGDDRVIVLGKSCNACRIDHEAYFLSDGDWARDAYSDRRPAVIDRLNPDSNVEIRNVIRRQVFVDGEPLGDNFE